MEKQYVIDSVTKKIKRYGYSDFQNDGSFDSLNEEIVIGEYGSFPDEEERYWNGASFQLTPI